MCVCVCVCVYIYIFFFFLNFLSLWEPEREERGIQWWETWLRRIVWTLGVVSPLDGPGCMWRLTWHVCHWKSPVSAGSQQNYPGKTTRYRLCVSSPWYQMYEELLTPHGCGYYFFQLHKECVCVCVADSICVWHCGPGSDWSVSLISDHEGSSVYSQVIWKIK